MAVTYIPIDNTKTLGIALLDLAKSARDFGEQLAAVQAVMAGMVDGTDYTVLEAQFGIPAGKGADLSYMLGVLKTSLDAVPQFALLPNWLGQV